MRRAFLLLLIIFPVLAKETLTLEQFVELAKKNDPSLEKILLEKKHMEFIVDQGLPEREFLLELKNEYGIPDDNSAKDNSWSATLSKEIIESGTKISISQSDSESTFQQAKTTQVKVEQPLLRNFFGLENRLLKASLLGEKEMVQLEMMENYEDYLALIIKTYLEYAQAYLNKNLSEEIYQELLTLKRNVMAKYQKKVANSTDVDRINLEVILQKEDIIQKSILLENKQQEIKKIISKDDLLPAPEVEIDIEQRFNFSPTYNPEQIRRLLLAKRQEEIGRSKLDMEKRSILPELNLIAGQSREESTRYTNKTDRTETLVGVELTIPLGTSTKKANIQSSALQLANSQIESKIAFADFTKKAKQLQAELEQLQEQLRLGKEKISIASRILKDELRRYTYGTKQLEELIDTRNKLSEYRFTYHSNLLSYNKVMVDWLNLTDRLLAKTAL